MSPFLTSWLVSRYILGTCLKERKKWNNPENPFCNSKKKKDNTKRKEKDFKRTQYT